MQPNYSIIICSYNPELRIFERCLNAVSQLNTEGLSVEVILIDNNSSVPLAGLTIVKDMAAKLDNFTLVNEAKQGLTAARLAGVAKATGEVVVFFDDDNEPEPDYLQELSRLNKSHNHIVAWGPGNISVDFIDGIAADIEGYARSVFQERHTTTIAYANTRTWQDCYPFGTGMSVKASYLQNYVRLVSENAFTLSDRNGNSLSSGGDVQIVLTCIKQGGGAGIAPGLRLKHMIPAKRANVEYIKRLLYGVFIGGPKTRAEVFPEHYEIVRHQRMRKGKFTAMAIAGYLKLSLGSKPDDLFAFITELASNCGIYLAINRPIPTGVKWVIKRLKLE